MNARKQAQHQLERLIALDTQTNRAYYDMGAILSSIAHGQLYDELGFDSMRHMVEETCSFGPSTAARYMRTYRKFRSLRYTKAEALALVHKFGFTNVSNYLLYTAQTKASKRHVARAIRAYKAARCQINFQLKPEVKQQMEEVLTRLGAERTETGMLQHSSEAFGKMVQLARASLGKKNVVPMRKVA